MRGYGNMSTDRPSCIQCPHCGELLFLGRTTVGIVCSGCRRYIRESEFNEPDPEKFPERGPTLLIRRDDPNMQIWRRKREKLDRMCEARSARAADRKRRAADDGRGP